MNHAKRNSIEHNQDWKGVYRSKHPLKGNILKRKPNFMSEELAIIEQGKHKLRSKKEQAQSQNKTDTNTLQIIKYRAGRNEYIAGH